MQCAESVHLGGASTGEGNLISGNIHYGVLLDGFDDVPSHDIEILGNRIGVAADGVTPLGNGQDGILVGELQLTAPDATDIRIGGVGHGEGNVISSNGSDGVRISDPESSGISIRGNSIVDNTGLAVDLGNDGVTANDSGDGDSGANGLQNYPVLATADPGAGVVTGTLDSTPGTTFTVDLSLTSTPDPSGYGEAATYLGSTTVTTDAGSGVGTFTVSGLALTPGAFLTATATAPDGSTSEYSACLLVQAATGIFADDFESGNTSAWSAAAP